MKCHPYTRYSTLPSEHGEEPIEDLEWDIDQLLQILRDMDQACGEDAQDLKEHMNHIEDGLRNLADFVRRQPPPPALVPEAQPHVEMPTPIIIWLELVQMLLPQPASPISTYFGCSTLIVCEGHIGGRIITHS